MKLFFHKEPLSQNINHKSLLQNKREPCYIPTHLVYVHQLWHLLFTRSLHVQQQPSQHDSKEYLKCSLWDVHHMHLIYNNTNISVQHPFNFILPHSTFPDTFILCADGSHHCLMNVRQCTLQKYISRTMALQLLSVCTEWSIQRTPTACLTSWVILTTFNSRLHCSQRLLHSSFQIAISKITTIQSTKKI